MTAEVVAIVAAVATNIALEGVLIAMAAHVNGVEYIVWEVYVTVRALVGLCVSLVCEGRGSTHGGEMPPLGAGAGSLEHGQGGCAPVAPRAARCVGSQTHLTAARQSDRAAPTGRVVPTLLLVRVRRCLPRRGLRVMMLLLLVVVVLG